MVRRLLLILLAVIVPFACSTIRIDRPLATGTRGWTAASGGSERTNRASGTIVPPLRERWNAGLPAGVGPGGAAAAESLAVVGDLHGELHLFELSGGREIGSKSFGAAIVSRPVLDRDTVYLALTRSDPNLLAYALSSGRMIWKRAFPDVETDLLRLGDRLIAAAYAGVVLCVEKATGRTLWSFDVPAGSRTRVVRSSPASDGATVVFGCDDGSLYALDAARGTMLWKAQARESIIAPPSIDSGRVFAGSLDSSVYAFDLRTGAELWRRPLGASLLHGQAVGRDCVVVTTAAAEVFALRPSDGALLWRRRLESMAGAGPLLTDSLLVVPCIDRNVVYLGAMDGRERWRQRLDGRVRSIPLFHGGALLLMTDDRMLHSFRSNGGAP